MASSRPSRGSVTFGDFLSPVPQGMKVLLPTVQITGCSGAGTSSMISSPFGTACNAVAAADSPTTSARERMESRSDGSADCTDAAKNASASSRVSASITSRPLSELHHSRTWATSFSRPAIRRSGVSSCNSPVQFCHHASRSIQPEGGKSSALRANQIATAGASSNQALRSSASKARISDQGSISACSSIHWRFFPQRRGVTNTKVDLAGSSSSGSSVRFLRFSLAFAVGDFPVLSSHPDRPSGMKEVADCESTMPSQPPWSTPLPDGMSQRMSGLPVARIRRRISSGN